MRIPPEVTAILKKLEAAGEEAYAVGGCVRDTLLGRAPCDWDVTSSALPEHVLEIFGEDAIPTGLKHGTVTVRSGEQKVEVTTYREDGEYADHRHPQQVCFTRSLAEDLKRRDFTVNAMAMSLTGEIVDLHGGRADLAAGVLRAVGEAEQRFEEDALRILRGLRFASQLGFTVEEETARAMDGKKELLKEIAGERVREELTKLLCGKDVRRILMEYPHVLGAVLPEILPSVGFDHRNPHHCFDVWEHTACAVENVPPEELLRWVVLLHDVGKPGVCYYDHEAGKARFGGHQAESARMAEGVLERLRFDSAGAERILHLIRNHDRLVEPTEKGVRRLLRKFGEQDLRALLRIRRADNLAQHPDFRGLQEELTEAERLLEKILGEEQCFTLKQLAVDGHDLLALGLAGKAVGEMLETLLTAVVEEELPNRREALLKAAKEHKERAR